MFKRSIYLFGEGGKMEGDEKRKFENNNKKKEF